MKLLIVVDKLLTGFDAPPCTYLYIDKRMQDHGLFQAICRVNRLDDDSKDFGYIVDYKQLFGQLQTAMKDYTSGAFEGYDPEDVKGLVKDRHDATVSYFEEVYDAVEELCEGIEEPRGEIQYIHYFCGVSGQSEESDEIYARLREKLYRLVSSLVRAFAEAKPYLVDDISSGKLNEYDKKVTFYIELKKTIGTASGDFLDLKAYEPDMRKMIDNYITAADAEKIGDFDDLTLLDSLGEKGDGLILPEKYNGLGYQNLISIVFDLISYRDGWMRAGKSGTKDEIIEPLHLVLVEEPEAHLHVQVQQVFIRKAYSVLRNHEKLGKSEAFSTQLVISTHSSHIAREEEFANLRYFKRLPKDFEGKVATSKVVNLSDVFGKDDATKRFVTRYLQTTHCDLFFADGAILVEGSAEHMLLPHFIRNKYLKLNQRYITILNINGKHSHRLAPLINKLALPTLVIADLDSAEPTGHHKKAEPVRKQGLISGNYAITDWLIKKKLLDDLIDLPDSDKVFSMQSICPYQIRIAYQTPIKICYQNKEIEALSRTFEDSLIYSNWDTFKGMSVSDPGQLIKKLKEGLDNEDSFETIKSKIFESLKQSDVKAEFALDLIYSIDPNMMVVPQYIDKGLKWLEDLLCEEG